MFMNLLLSLIGVLECVLCVVTSRVLNGTDYLWAWYLFLVCAVLTTSLGISRIIIGLSAEEK